ncbi:MAG: hypothetical protein H7232_13320 [Aeromicrobium sp.]|nr:hypothetical protein [Burkholderiales bacterium]
MQDFWVDSGFGQLAVNDRGWLRVTPEYLRAVLMRAELAPIAESGPKERALHAALVVSPLRVVAAEELAGIEDADTRQNYMYFLRFRKLLTDAVTLERFYLQAFSAGAIDFPPVFIDMAAQAIVRGILAEPTLDATRAADGVYAVRAGELFFRRQRVSTENNRVLSADAETIQVFAESGGFGSVGRLFAQQGTPMRTMNMDVLSHENAQLYWFSENRYRYVIDLSHGAAGLDALAALLGRWIQHFFGIDVTVTALVKIEDEAWRWHIGLDVESTAILNDLYEGREVAPARLARLIGLFRVDFLDPADMRADVQGKPVYLGMATNEEHVLKLKPQNLLLNLPIAARS